MKKNLHVFSLLLLSLVLLVGCGDKGGTEGASGFKFDESTISVSAIGGNSIALLTAPGPWKAEVESSVKDWLTISPLTGAGGNRLEIAVTTSKFEEGQSMSGKAIFTLLSDGSQITLTVNRVDATPSRMTDSLALVALYQKTGGTGWKNRWDFRKPIRDWAGITTALVVGEDGKKEWRVTEILLTDNNFKGEIPEELGLISELKVINFDMSEWYETEPKFGLSGSIPASILGLKKLEVLAIAYNKLEGGIPAELFELTELYAVNLTGNVKLGGTLPETIGKAANLQMLNIANAALEGQIPASISNLTNLGVVELSGNKFTGALPSFNNNKKLSWFNISGNAEFKVEYYETNDSIWDKTENGLTIRRLPNEVYVSGGFTGPAPEFTDMPDLSTVGFKRCNFEGSPKFSNCPKLQQIHMDNNPSMGDLDESVVTLPALVILYANNCGITNIPASFNLPELQQMTLYNNKIVALPESIKNSPKLRILNVSYNNLQSVPDMFAVTKNLSWLYLGYNKITSVPASLWECRSISELELQSNEIVGELPQDPDAFGAHRSMNTFNIAYNKFSGSPIAVQSFPAVGMIYLGDNAFTGDVPSEFYSRGLSVLTMNRNNFTGTIPLNLSSLVSLDVLKLNGNKLSGVVPSKLVDMTNWCSFQPKKFIMPQQAGFELTGNTKDC